MRNIRYIIPILAIFFFSFVFIQDSGRNHSQALSGSQFKAGRIIDDSKFYRGPSMSTNQIKSFFQSKVPACDTHGQQMYNSTMTRKQYAASKGVSTPFICLKNFDQKTPGRSANAYCGTYNGGHYTSARIVYEVSKACRIDTKVLIVLLQKEQSLVTDDWPWPIQYRSATGYGCPDTAACDSQYYGFFNQVYNAAKQYNRYKQNGHEYNYRAGRTSYVQWHPRSSCGGSNVTMQNHATAGLYNYTPYRPNQAALNNLYSTGNSCSSYGNRNFWRIYNDWFGSTLKNIGFKTLDTPRWMQLKINTSKQFLPAEISDGGSLQAGQQIFFQTKIEIDGRVYLRTKHDTNRNINKGIPLSDIEEIDLEYESLDIPRWMELTTSLRKRHPLTETRSGSTLNKGRQIYFDSKVLINGQPYLRTRYDTNHGINRVIPYSLTKEVNVSFVSLDTPRWLKTTVSTYNKDPVTETNVGPVIAANTPIFFTTKVKVGNEVFLRSEQNTTDGNNVGIPLSDIGPFYIRLVEPREMRLKVDAYKKIPQSGADTGPLYEAGKEIFFATKVNVNGVWYLRTQHDTNNKYNRAFLLSDLESI